MCFKNKFLARLLLYMKHKNKPKMASKELKIFKDKAVEAYRKANSEGKALLRNMFGESEFNENIMDTVKTLQDVCAALGRDYDVEFSKERTKWLTMEELGHKEWRLIAEALNEGEVMDITNPNQPMYRPYVEYVSGRGLSLYYVYCVLSDAGIAPCFCFKNEALLRYAFKQFPDTFAKAYGVYGK